MCSYRLLVKIKLNIALWGKLPDVCSDNRPPEYRQSQQQAKTQAGSSDGEEKSWDEKRSQTVDIHHEEHQKHWYDIDEKRKKQLEVSDKVITSGALWYSRQDRSGEGLPQGLLYSALVITHTIRSVQREYYTHI